LHRTFVLLSDTETDNV